MAEMWTRSPIMQGNTEQHQLTLISQLCGSITPEVRVRAGMSCGEQESGQSLGPGTRAFSLSCMLAAVCSQQWSVPAAGKEAVFWGCHSHKHPKFLLKEGWGFLFSGVLQCSP